MHHSSSIANSSEVQAIRDASRRIVRALGFMQPTIAGTDLSASAVHALVEIGASAGSGATGLAAHDLAARLQLDKSSISRLLARLVAKGLILERRSPADRRAKLLCLTPGGAAQLEAINRFAGARVSQALDGLDVASRRQVVAGLSAYAAALEADGRGFSAKPEIEITQGMQPGALGWIVEAHGRYYHREWGFGPFFEAKVAAGLAEFIPRLERPQNALWLAVQQGSIKGSAAIDGEDLGNGMAHLRWVIVDDDARGLGIGQRLLREALRFCDQRKFDAVQLWTFKGLDAARALYEREGFRLTQEYEGDQWGGPITEQVFVRRLPD